MSNLLKFNFRKLRMQKTFYIFMGVIIGMNLLTAVMIKVMISMGSTASTAAQLKTYKNITAFDFGLSAIEGSSFITIMGIVIALAVCNDFEQRTVKTIFARGYSHTQFYFSKLWTMFAATTIAFIITVLSGYVIGFIFFGTGDVKFRFLKTLVILGGQYIAVLANAAFIFMLSFLFKRSGLSITIAIIAPIVMSLVLQLGEALIKSDDIKLANYWVTTCFTPLSSIDVTVGKIITCLVVSIAYAIAFVSAGAALSKKTEV